jgi:Rod binding domain-containing protein
MIAPPAFDPWVAALGSKGSVSQGGIDRSARQAAEQFEALLIRQFLSNARSTSWLSDQQESESGWREIADDSLAGYLVKAGGLGLTKQVESLIAQAQRSRAQIDPVNESNVSSLAAASKALNPSRDSTVNSR